MKTDKASNKLISSMGTA